MTIKMMRKSRMKRTILSERAWVTYHERRAAMAREQIGLGVQRAPITNYYALYKNADGT